MSEPIEPTTHQIPGWDRPAWAIRGVRDGPELIWQREASIDVTYMDGGVEETFAPEAMAMIGDWIKANPLRLSLSTPRR